MGFKLKSLLCAVLLFTQICTPKASAVEVQSLLVRLSKYQLLPIVDGWVDHRERANLFTAFNYVPYGYGRPKSYELSSPTKSIHEKFDSFKDSHSGIVKITNNSISTEGIIYICNTYDEIKELLLNKSSYLTDQFFHSLRHPEKLKSVDLTDCKGITDETLFFLAQCCPELTSLKLSKCMNITDEGVSKIAEVCTQLEDLDISGCSITDEGVSRIAEGCTKLTSLDISGHDITDSAIRKIADSCPGLKSLNKLGCHLLSNEAIDYLKQKLPNLEIKK